MYACNEPNPENAALLEVNIDGSGRRIFAKGLRNTIGFDWHPTTQKLFGCDHGIDWLGDEQPREEHNELKDGADYGWPWVYEDRRFNRAIERRPARRLKAMRPQRRVHCCSTPRMQRRST